MANTMEELPVEYEDLAEIEREFDDVETEIIRQQIHLSRHLYARRQRLVARIPNFWPLVLEQAPPDIDQYIQPSDSALLLSALLSLEVEHFEVADPAVNDNDDNNNNNNNNNSNSNNSNNNNNNNNDKHSHSAPAPAPANGKPGSNGDGDPRSVAVRFEFAENEHFADRVLEKRFWYRRARDGWAGLVSEPVRVAWKKQQQQQQQKTTTTGGDGGGGGAGGDLTGGLLDLVCDAWEAQEKAAAAATAAEKTTAAAAANGGETETTEVARTKTARGRTGPRALTAEQKALRAKMDATGMGGLSFFAWFGYVGRRISAEESAEAERKEAERRAKRERRRARGMAGGDGGATGNDGDDDGGRDDDDDEEEEEEEEGEDDQDDVDLEIFPDGEELAIAISEDLWPGALKYFTQAQEQDPLSDADFESEDDDGEDFDAALREIGDEEEEEEEEDEAPPVKKRRA